jgi:histone deacetylase complex regulatory component SIN3
MRRAALALRLLTAGVLQTATDADKSTAGEAAGASQPGSTENTQSQASPPGQGGNTCEAIRKKFFQLLYRHIVHKSDVTAFEDSCRSMLGANSYVLFTIQKLVNKFARHLASVIAVRTPHCQDG